MNIATTLYLIGKIKHQITYLQQAGLVTCCQCGEPIIPLYSLELDGEYVCNGADCLAKAQAAYQQRLDQLLLESI